jgi:hypothetical protein
MYAFYFIMALGLGLLGGAVLAVNCGKHPKGAYADHQVDSLTLLFMPLVLMTFGFLALLIATAGTVPVVNHSVSGLLNGIPVIHPLIKGLIVLAVVGAMSAYGHQYWPKKLARWATAYQWTLVEYNVYNPWEGTLFHSKGPQRTFTVRLATADDDIKTALVTFGDYWGFSPGDVSLEWQNEAKDLSVSPQ